MKTMVLKNNKKMIQSNGNDFRLEIQIVSNPDFHQYFKPMKVTITAETLKDLKVLQRQFIDESMTGESSEFPIGGGNWGHKTSVFAPDNQLIGRMSYNGRIWNEKEEEVLV